MRRLGIGHVPLGVAVGATGALAVSTARAETSEAPDSASQVRPLLIGATAPGVTLRRTDGGAFDLQAAIQKQPSVVIFYRGGW